MFARDGEGEGGRVLEHAYAVDCNGCIGVVDKERYGLKGVPLYTHPYGCI